MLRRSLRLGLRSVSETDISQIQKLVGEANTLTAEADVAPFNTDWLNQWKGNSRLVVLPKTAEQLSAVMRYCSAEGIGVCPQGGNTGLTGGSVPVNDEVVVSMGKMNKIHSFDGSSNTIVCDAGCVLEALNQELSQHGAMMPLDLGAKGSCHIGGNVATNAGGLRFLRYGSLHQNVLGLEAVLADGTVLDCMNTLKKDNTGYDLKQLFIGSEGHLGIITKLALQVAVLPRSVNVAFLALPDFASVRRTLAEARLRLGEVLSAFEFIDADAMESTLDVFKHDYPLESKANFYVLIETHGSNADHDSEKLNQFLEFAMGEELVSDGTVSDSFKQAQNLWRLREDVPSALPKMGGYVHKYDVSLPLEVMYDLVEETKRRTKGISEAVQAFGHVGDGNLHLNIMSTKDPEGIAATKAVIEPFIYEWTGNQNGSVSAEHGIGQQKKAYLPYSKSPEAILLMRKMKEMMDPKGILNPHKILTD